MSGEKHTLLEWRERTRLNRAEFGRYAGISGATVGFAENGKRPPTQDTLFSYITGLEKYFAENPQLLGDWELPQRPSDFAGVTIYNASTMRGAEKEKNTN